MAAYIFSHHDDSGLATYAEPPAPVMTVLADGTEIVWLDAFEADEWMLGSATL